MHFLGRSFQIPIILKLSAPPLLRPFPQRILSASSPRRASSSSELDASAAAAAAVVADAADPTENFSPSNKGCLKSGLYLVATPIGNLEDITLRLRWRLNDVSGLRDFTSSRDSTFWVNIASHYNALRILKSADVILSEDTRHSWKLLQHYNIDTPLLSYHKFNEFQRKATVLRRLQEGQAVALITDAGTPGISDPGVEIVKLCARENIVVTPIPGPSALVAALSACGLPTNEFTFVGFLAKHAGSRRSRLIEAANETATQIFFVPPHKLLQFLVEASSIFGYSRLCVIAREMTKIHEEFWRGTLEDATKVFSSQQPRGEITLLIEGILDSPVKAPSEDELEHELKDLISKGHSTSEAVKIVAEGTSVKRKEVYALALRLFAKNDETKGCS